MWLKGAASAKTLKTFEEMKVKPAAMWGFIKSDKTEE
jgi:hypothetical protein